MAWPPSDPNMSAALLPQVAAIHHAHYVEWVHRPQHNVVRARIFASSRLEALSHTRWWVVPLVWVPVLTMVWGAAARAHGALSAPLGLAAAGAASWTLVEYVLHRFVFHVDARLPDAGWARQAHFLLHGVHHLVPNDPGRLVFPPVLAFALAIPVAAVLRIVTWALLSPPLFWCYFAGLAAGYVAYDVTHYALHHGVHHGVHHRVLCSRRSHCGRMRAYHGRHHFPGQETAAFGVTSRFWDRVFGTRWVMGTVPTRVRLSVRERG